MSSPARSFATTEAPLPPAMDDAPLRVSGYMTWAQNEALRLFGLLGHWSEVSAELAPYLSLSPASWWAVSKGRKVTRAKVNALRVYNGMPPLPEMRLVRVCPSCGEIHGTGIDCHGQPITVIALASGEHIAKDGQKRKPSGKSAWTPDLQRWRKRLGVTIREVIEAGLFAIEEEQEEHHEAPNRLEYWTAARPERQPVQRIRQHKVGKDGCYGGGDAATAEPASCRSKRWGSQPAPPCYSVWNCSRPPSHHWRGCKTFGWR